MYRTAIVLALFGPSVPGFTEDKDTVGKLDGSYSIISGEKEGRVIPTQDLEGSIITIKDGKIVGTHKNREEFFSCPYTIDASAKPFKISMTNTSPNAQAKKAMGIIDVNGDMVSLCYNLPNGDVPTSFKTREKQHCFVLKRINP